MLWNLAGSTATILINPDRHCEGYAQALREHIRRLKSHPNLDQHQKSVVDSTTLFILPVVGFDSRSFYSCIYVTSSNMQKYRQEDLISQYSIIMTVWNPTAAHLASFSRLSKTRSQKHRRMVPNQHSWIQTLQPMRKGAKLLREEEKKKNKRKDSGK